MGGWNTCYGDGGDGYSPVGHDFDPAEEPPKGACPACGCEELDSRGLWTCECPAPSQGTKP